MYLCLWGMDTFNGTAEDSHVLYSTIFINSVAFEWNSGAHTRCSIKTVPGCLVAVRGTGDSDPHPSVWVGHPETGG